MQASGRLHEKKRGRSDIGPRASEDATLLAHRSGDVEGNTRETSEGRRGTARCGSTGIRVFSRECFGRRGTARVSRGAYATLRENRRHSGTEKKNRTCTAHQYAPSSMYVA